MGTILGISIPVILLAAALLTLAGTIWHFYKKAKHTMKDLFGTDNLNELIKSREEEQASTPKSVSGLTSIYVPLIQKDFPELNWVELKGIAEGHLKEHLREKKLTDIRIHKTEVFSYIKNSGTCVIVFQSGVQYLTGTKKVQTRYNTHMMYIQDAIEYGKESGFSVTCPHCGGALTSLGAKFCEYCGSEVIPINIHVWDLHKIEEV
ncbi:MAG: zinc ribbon domain-containing protein [Lachnospiraceae bacterium]|nr:zinc ribbon domain-containing protein [Lachnospiraceae bacterium]